MLKSYIKSVSLAIVLLAFASGCVTRSSASPGHAYKRKNPELTSTNAKTGIASWYGPRFYGRKTASGERFTKYGMTCAHKTLPFGTKLEITNLSNNQSVEVVVNDRGPYIHPRVIDLSYAAAEKIDMLKTGTAKVQYRIVSSTSNKEVVLSKEEKKKPSESEKESL